MALMKSMRSMLYVYLLCIFLAVSATPGKLSDENGEE